MTQSLQATPPVSRAKEVLSVLAAIVVFLTIAGILGYGNFASTPLGLVVIVLTGYVAVRLVRRD